MIVGRVEVDTVTFTGEESSFAGTDTDTAHTRFIGTTGVVTGTAMDGARISIDASIVAAQTMTDDAATILRAFVLCHIVNDDICIGGAAAI